MASESTSSQQSQQLIPSLKVNFKKEDGTIAFNNVVALLEHSNEMYQPMLSFLSNCCIKKALTLQPFAMYVEYLQEFWYTAEVKEETKTITFLLSWLYEPLSFTQKEFISSIGLPVCKNLVPLPPNETVRAGLSLIPSSGEVNANDTADKSLSRACEQPVTQSKAPTDLKTKKKNIPSSSQPKSPHKEPEKIVEIEKDAEDNSMEIPTVEQLLDEVDKQIKIPKLQDQIMHDSDESADYESMPEDDLRSVSSFEDVDSDDTQGNEVSHSDHTFLDHNDFANRLSLPDHLDHICEEVSSLHSKLDTLRDCLPSIIQESLQTYIQASFKKFSEKQTKLNKRVVKHLNRQFNIFHVAQSDRFARLETELSKTLKSDMGKSVTTLVKSVVIIDDIAEGEKNKKAKDPNPAATQGGPQSAEPLVESQREKPADLNIVNKESASPAFDAKINGGKKLVVHKSEDKKS
nr:hypothetical protein [Tanacetum cinerariifolium]